MFKQFRIILYIFPIFLVGIFFDFSVIWAQTSLITADIQISVCGNNIVEADEECDNSDFNNQSCSSFGFNSGSLSCNPDCTINSSGCSGSNNNGGGGGGGGGGSSNYRENNVIFIGHAYPGGKVVLLKDGQEAGSILAGSDANFEISLAGLSSGNYTFSIYGEDKAGNRSSKLSFTINLTSGTTTKVSGIFISPTIDIDKQSVRQGESISIFGYAFPQSKMIISVSSAQQFFVTSQADDTGYYIYSLDSGLLGFGEHTVKSRSIFLGEGSDFSRSVNFEVGDLSSYRRLDQDSESDLNKDNKINLIDFSILAYWHKRPAPPIEYDLNSDSKIDLIDFSIMAYYWSG